MIITCPCGEKKFNVDTNLIPDKGRLLKCGACNETWFFNKKEQVALDIYEDISSNKNFEQKKEHTYSSKVNEEKNVKVSDIPKNKGSELVKYKTKSSFTISKFPNYIIVLIVSLIGLIILLDTFKSPLSIIFPDLELLLYNIFETLKDLLLFTKDLL